ncbi:MAG: outer membrane protein assembly factor BamA [Paracoccaceae bacterium]
MRSASLSRPGIWARATAFWTLLAALMILDVASPGRAEAQQFAQAAREQSVVVRGNRRIETETILSYMDLRQGQTVTAEDLNRAVRRLFDTGLFRDVQVVPAADRLVVEVVENPSINQIAFEGNDALSDENALQIISLRPRLPFTVSAAEADAQALIEIYRRTGRYGAEVEPVIIERPDNRVDLVFEVIEGDLTGVSSIDFVGNQVYSNRRLRGVIETSETGLLSQFLSSDVYDPDRLELDKELLRQYYFDRGYADFTVLSATAELAPERDGFFITFTVNEGEEYTFGDLNVNVSARGLDQERFLAAIPGDLTGDTYSASEIEQLSNTMTDLAGQAGFAFVQVRPRPRKNAEDRVIDVTFEIAEGPRVFIERIEIEGNTQTLDRVIRRNIDLVEGDPFDARKIRRARSRIRGLRYFSRVELETEEGSAEDRATLKVKVEEQSTGSLSFGLGFSSSAGPIGNVAVTERNFLGRGQVVNAEVTAAGDTQIYDFSFTEPAFLDRDLSVGMRGFFIDDDRSDESDFEISRLGGGPTIGFPLAENTRIQLRYEFLREDISVSGQASPVIQADDGVRNTSRFGATLTYDGRNDPVETTGGYFLTASQDFAGAGGDAQYWRSSNTAKLWTSFFSDQIITSLEFEVAGIIGFGDDIRVNERFFLGGANLRGFADEGAGPRDVAADDSLGGNYRAISRLEVSFPLGFPEELGIFGGAFVDAGTLFRLDTTALGQNGQPIDDDPKLRVGAGGLLFLDTPFGPLELSFGVPLIQEDEDESEFFRLSIGTRF